MPRTKATRPSIRKLAVTLSLLLVLGACWGDDHTATPTCKAAKAGNLSGMLDAVEDVAMPGSPISDDINNIRQIFRDPRYRHGPSSPENKAALKRFRDYIKSECEEDITKLFPGLE